MSRLNDAIAYACYGKTYSAVLAAEGAGKLPEVPTVPPNIVKAARKYHINSHAFGQALHAALQPLATPSGGGVFGALDWLAEHYRDQINQMAATEFFGLAEEKVIRAVFDNERHLTWEMAFAEWVIAEGTFLVDGQPIRPIELLEHSYLHRLSSDEQQFLVALGTTPLRLYLVESVVPGYSIQLRQIGTADARTVTVRERSASAPFMQGTTVAARLVPVGDHLEISGGLLQFSEFHAQRLTTVVRSLESTHDISKAIRRAWLDHFDPSRQPLPQFVSYEGDPIVLITDTYHCKSVAKLAQHLASDQRFDGSPEDGWALLEIGDDGEERLMCAINVAMDTTDKVTTCYQTEQRAARFRPIVEAAAGDLLRHLERTSQLPSEMSGTTTSMTKDRQKIPPDVLTALIDSTTRKHYASWADDPLPILDGQTPRQAIRSPDGETRVRELLAMYQSHELRMAEEEQRDPISYDFLYVALGLAAPSKTSVDQQSVVLQPSSFQVNEAWVAFRLMKENVSTSDAGLANVVGLMDAASTFILNYHIERIGVNMSQFEARRLLTQFTATAPPPHLARTLYVPTTLNAPAMIAEASSLGMHVIEVHEDALLPIIGEARSSIATNFAKMLSGRR